MSIGRITLTAFTLGLAIALCLSPALLLLIMVGLALVGISFLLRNETHRAIRRVMIYGGTFSPVHNGHLAGAEWMRCKFDLDRVHFVLSGTPPHKEKNVLPAPHRFEMLKAALAPNGYFVADDTEIKRTGKSYTVDTVREFRRKYGPNVELFLVLGSEYLDPDHEWYLPKWTGSEVIFAECTILMFPRLVDPEQSQAAGIRQVQEWIGLVKQQVPGARMELLVDFPTIQFSSTLIRDRVRDGQSVWYMTPYEVWRLIRDRGHYLAPGQAPLRRSPLHVVRQTAGTIYRELRYVVSALWN